MTQNVAGEPFANELRRVLNHLYNPAELRRSPLLNLLVPGRDNRLTALRQIITDSIQALRPSTQVPPHSNAWRVYHTLVWRYLEQWSQKDVAANLAIGSRQLRRIEQVAVKVLADYLWARYDLEPRRDEIATSFRARQEAGDGAHPSDHRQELEWLGQSLPSEVIQIADLVRECLGTIEPLLSRLGVRVACDVPDDLPVTSGQPLPMRQAVLNILSAAARSTPGGRLEIAARAGEERLCVRVGAVAAGTALAFPSQEAGESLSMARELLALCGGELQVESLPGPEQGLAISAVLPAGRRIPVLVVDDNADTLQLFKRYLSGSGYAFVGTTDPEEMLSLAAELAPGVILLDVMVPGMDGWQLLSRLRQHPKTRQVPVLVCTILPLEQLALSLGANGFIRKPVSREALLAALDQFADCRATGWR
ncbi:MAG: response regulator [Anaerolineae bacterium]|nr:response regulator [Anaerolineae bacterium]